MGGNIPGGNFLGGNFPGRGGFSRGEFDGWEFSGSEFSRGEFPRTILHKWGFIVFYAKEIISLKWIKSNWFDYFIIFSSKNMIFLYTLKIFFTMLHLKNIFRIINNSVYFQNIVLRNEPFIEFNMKNIFLEKWYTKWGGETSSRSFSKKSKLIKSLDQQSEILHSLFLSYVQNVFEDYQNILKT